MGDLSSFSVGQIVGARLAGTSITKTAILLGVSRAAVPKVVTTYTYHRKALSAQRQIGRKPKLNERRRRTLKRIVSKNDRTAGPKSDKQNSIFICFHKTVERELHKSSIHCRDCNC